MAQFKVTIKRTITTTILVDAQNEGDATKKIWDYGLTEAVSDMASQDEKVTERIAKVELA